MKLDILAFAAHPDDAELACSGTLMKHIALGMKVGVVDLTRGELGTRGTAETRAAESKAATALMGLHVRENLGLADGFFENDKDHKMVVVQAIRKYKPTIVLANAVSDRHPDHGRAAQLVSEACFLAGLIKISTQLDGAAQEAWKPQAVYHCIQDRFIKPDLIVDITEYMERKMLAIRAYETQFFNPDSKEPMTAISKPEFIDFLFGRAAEYGRTIGTKYGEGFTVERTLGVNNLASLL